MSKTFLKKAVDLSRESLEQGKFPAGAVITKGDMIVDTETSTTYPHQHFHAETKLIDQTMAEIDGQLGEYELYTSLAPCLMCLGKIYWSGISKVYYVLSRKDVDTKLSYEGPHDFEGISNSCPASNNACKLSSIGGNLDLSNFFSHSQAGCFRKSM